MRTDLDHVERLARRDHHLAVVATTRADGTIQCSVVNAGIVSHPLSGGPVVAFATYGPAKLAHLRARSQVSLTFRAQWEWATVEGNAELMGPDDPVLEPERLRVLIRDIFTAAGGDHEDWEEFDRVMAQERRAAVLVRPHRVYTN